MPVPFSGLIPPICTPLNLDGRIDQDSLASLIEHQISAGVNGIFVLGSSGEAAYLTDADRKLVVDTSVAAIAGRVPLLVGALDTTARRVVDQIRALDTDGVDAFVVTAPFYANCSDDEVATHFISIAADTGRPLLAYDIPGNVGRRLDVGVAARLLGEGIIAGLKDSSGTLTDFGTLIRATGPARTVSLLTGVDSAAASALDLGADGLIPGLANIRPHYFVKLIGAHANGDRRSLTTYQTAITRLVRIFAIGQDYGLGRHASELGGLKSVLVNDGIIAQPVVSAPMSAYPAGATRDLLELVSEIDAQLSSALLSDNPDSFPKESQHA